MAFPKAPPHTPMPMREREQDSARSMQPDPKLNSTEFAPRRIRASARECSLLSHSTLIVLSKPHERDRLGQALKAWCVGTSSHTRAPDGPQQHMQHTQAGGVQVSPHHPSTDCLIAALPASPLVSSPPNSAPAFIQMHDTTSSRGVHTPKQQPSQ